MADAPDLAEMIAAVRRSIEPVEMHVTRMSILGHGDICKHGAHLAALRATLRLLEALADRNAVAQALFDNDSDAHDEQWEELGESIREVYRLHADGFASALLARASDND